MPFYRNAGAVNIDSIVGGSELTEDDPQDEPALLLTRVVNDAALNENVTDTTDSTFGMDHTCTKVNILKIKRHCTGSSPMLLLQEILNFGQRDQASRCR